MNVFSRASITLPIEKGAILTNNQHEQNIRNKCQAIKLLPCFHEINSNHQKQHSTVRKTEKFSLTLQNVEKYYKTR